PLVGGPKYTSLGEWIVKRRKIDLPVLEEDILRRNRLGITAASEPPAETVLTPLSPLPLAKPDLSTNPLLPSIAAAHNARHAAAIANLMTGSGTTAAEHRILVVQPGDSLMGLLGRLGLAPEEARTLMAALPDRFDARRLRPGHQIRVLIERPLTDGWSPTGLTTPAIVRRLTIDPAPAEPIRLERTVEDGFIILSEAEGASPAWPSGTRTVRAYGPIRSSLYETTAQLGLPKAVINDFVKLFSSDVDFQREIHRGDQFDLLYTPDKGSDGGVIDYGALTLRARTVEFYRYTTADGKTGYFDAQGRSAGKSFLRTPIDGARISSGFGPRMHPILGFTKMHQGVDFAAPAGTPVYAAGAGKLTHVGRRGSFGHYVGIQHADGYTTAYAHLAGYPKGLRVGQTVTQGQVIGFVGSTGRSTGPHLHYEVHKNKRPIDPMRHKGSTRLVLNDSERATFERYKDRLHQVRRTAFTVSSKQTAIAR
ncbi:MAG: M23 family metallopeptidase, partial [Pseudomonadota bacterium]